MTTDCLPGDRARPWGALALSVVCAFVAGAGCSSTSAPRQASAGNAGEPAAAGTGGAAAGASAAGAAATAGLAASGGANARGGAGSTATAGMSSSSGGASNGAGGSGRDAGGAGPGSGGTSAAGRGAAGGAGVASGSAGAPDVVGTPTEQALAKLPTVRQEHSVAALDGEIYVIGGYTPGGGSATLTPTDSVIAYDPTRDSWRDVASLPGPLNHGNVGVVGDKLYLAGFYTNGGMSTATTESLVYDPTADAWTEIAPLPLDTQRAASCVAVAGGLLYVIGGANEGKSVDDAARYDPALDSWEVLPALPERREHCAAGAIGDTIYVAGGRVDGITGIEPKTYAFDTQQGAWSEVAPLPTPRGGLAGGVLGGRLYVFGGEGNMAVSSGVFPNIDVYDPASDRWQTIGQMLVPRHGFGAAVLDDKIYLPGGATHQGGGASDENSVFFLE